MNLQMFIPSTYHFSTHRYYFLIIEISILLGWFIEKIPQLLEKPSFKRHEQMITCVLSLILFEISRNPAMHFFRGNLTAEASSYFDNTLLLIGIVPGLYLLTWLYQKLSFFRSFFKQPILVAVAILGLTITGYSLMPSELKEGNRRFPFDNAYRWLKTHGKPGEVVLTASPTRIWLQDYLILYTGLKTYCSPHFGPILSQDIYAEKFRETFLAGLLGGHLTDIAMPPAQTLVQKIQLLRLNYILINLPSPFMEKIQKQLEGFLEEVYRDERSLIWRVSVPSGAT